MPDPSAATKLCAVNNYSSRVCEKGTKGCTIVHGAPFAATCRYCAGKGGRYRLVYSRFLGCEPQAHEGPWEKCWACNGTGKEDKRGERV